MASASLKERMRQLQALKTSVEMKSQAVLAREKELAQLAQQSSVRKLNLESLPDDDQTIGADTQTTAGETAASPATPLPPPLGMEEESSKPDPPPEDFPPDEKEETSRAATPSDEIPQEKDQEVSFPEQPPGLIQGVESDETTLSQQLHDVIPTTEENESSKLETPEEASQRTEEDEFEGKVVMWHMSRCRRLCSLIFCFRSGRRGGRRRRGNGRRWSRGRSRRG